MYLNHNLCTLVSKTEYCLIYDNVQIQPFTYTWNKTRMNDSGYHRFNTWNLYYYVICAIPVLHFLMFNVYCS